MESDLDYILNNLTGKSKNKTKQIVHEEKLGQNSKEINPYWKNGGSGMPTDNSSRKQSATAGDGGLSWWKKALQRCKETAADEGKSLEEVTTERYGSLEFLHNKIKEAELYLTSVSSSDRRGRESFAGRSFVRPNDSKDSRGYSVKNHEVDRRSGDKRNQTHDRRDVDRRKGFDKRDDRRETEERKHVDHKRNNDRGIQDNNDGCSSMKSYDLHDQDTKVKTDSRSLVSSKNTESQVSGDVHKQMTAEERNKISAKLLRAEMMGDKDLVNQLKAMLNGSKQSDSTTKKRVVPQRNDDDDEDEEILVLTNQRGGAIPFPDTDYPIESRLKPKKQKVETHRDGKRVKYFHDDEHKTLDALVREEKLNQRGNDIDTFNRMAGRATRALYEDETIDDEMLRNETKHKSGVMLSKQKQLAIIEQKKMSSKIENCAFCFKNIQKHLVVSMGTKALLCLPRHKSMVPGHCLIVALQHVLQSTVCDEDVLEEIKMYKKSLVRMFEAEDEEVVFMETCKDLNFYPHLVIECIPISKEIGEVAPICFQKSINDCGPEWSNNKKLVKIKNGVKRSIPAGFPYFHVSFGMEDGYGHVIEDEEGFPPYFGREVLGGLMDLDSTLWRKPRFDDFEVQRKKVVEFTKRFKIFDPALSE